MSVLADRASGAGVLDRLQVLRSAPTPLRGAPAATWLPSPRTGVRQLRVAGPGLQPWLQDTTTTRTDPAGSTLATPVLGPRNGVHLPSRESLPPLADSAGGDRRRARAVAGPGDRSSGSDRVGHGCPAWPAAGGDWSTFIELFGDRQTTGTIATSASVDGGLTWLVTDIVQVDVSVGRGLWGPTDDVFVDTGLSFRLPR